MLTVYKDDKQLHLPSRFAATMSVKGYRMELIRKLAGEGRSLYIGEIKESPERKTVMYKDDRGFYTRYVIFDA